VPFLYELRVCVWKGSYELIIKVKNVVDHVVTDDWTVLSCFEFVYQRLDHIREPKLTNHHLLLGLLLAINFLHLFLLVLRIF